MSPRRVSHFHENLVHEKHKQGTTFASVVRSPPRSRSAIPQRTEPYCSTCYSAVACARRKHVRLKFVRSLSTRFRSLTPILPPSLYPTRLYPFSTSLSTSPSLLLPTHNVYPLLVFVASPRFTRSSRFALLPPLAPLAPLPPLAPQYHVGDIVLGEGMTSCVKICTKVATGQRYALKTLQINRMDPAKMQELRDEITIMKGLDHPHIVRLYDVHEEKNKMYLVMEYCEGGELFDRLFQQEGGKFTECKAAQLVQKMLASIHFMHTRNICHRDLKLENFIFEDQTVDSQLKLIDFGLSHRYTKNENMRNILGTSYYMAPEVLKQEYNNKCDLWSIGVIT